MLDDYPDVSESARERERERARARERERARECARARERESARARDAWADDAQPRHTLLGTEPEITEPPVLHHVQANKSAGASQPCLAVHCKGAVGLL
jgi:hypothetical protein